MKFTYSPEGGDPRTWSFRPTKMLNIEAELLEELTGWTWPEFGERFNRQSSKAYHALLFVFLHRTTPGLRYEQVQFNMDEIDVDYEDLEIVQMHDALVEQRATLDNDEVALMESLALDIEKRGLRLPKEASEPIDEVSISGSSPTSSTFVQPTSTD